MPFTGDTYNLPAGAITANGQLSDAVVQHNAPLTDIASALTTVKTNSLDKDENLSNLANPNTALTNLGGTAAGINLFKATTFDAALTSLGGGAYGTPIFKAATRAAVGLMAGLVSTGNGTADDTASFSAANAAGGLHFIQRPATAYNFAAPFATTAAAWLPDPTLTWAQLTDSGNFDMLRGGHFTDAGANIWRFSDRMFIGEAASKWSAKQAGATDVGTSWFGNAADSPAYLGVGATLLVTAPIDTASGLKIAATFAAKAEASTSAAMALGLSVENARTAGPGGASWAMYIDAFHLAGAGSWTYGAEIEVRNSSGVNNNPHPYGFTAPGALGIWLAASDHRLYGPDATGPNAAGIVIGSNNSPGVGVAKWNHAIVVLANALQGTDGTAGSTTYGTAISLPRNAKITWYEPGTNTEGASITSGVTTAAGRMAMEFRNNAIRFDNVAGKSVLLLVDIASAVNYVQINNTTAGSDPKIQAAGDDANIDLWFGAKGTGTMRFGNWTTSADVAVNGYVTIKDDAGTTRRLATVA